MGLHIFVKPIFSDDELFDFYLKRNCFFETHDRIFLRILQNISTTWVYITSWIMQHFTVGVRALNFVL